MDIEVKLRQVLQPMSLLPSKILGVAEVGEVLVVGDYIDRNWGTFEVMPPFLECFKYCKEFLIIDVIILFSRVENSGVEGNWVQFLFYIS